MSCADGYNGQGSGCAACGAPCTAELRAAAVALLAKLPRCDECSEIATRHTDGYNGDSWTRCDDHRRFGYARDSYEYEATPLPYAAVVRALRKVVEG